MWASVDFIFFFQFNIDRNSKYFGGVRKKLKFQESVMGILTIFWHFINQTIKRYTDFSVVKIIVSYSLFPI